MRERTPPDTDPRAGAAARDRLDSWKEIAAYLNRDVRTLHRWEASEGLPVHRHVHRKQGTVYAFRSELDAWQRSRGRRPAAAGSGTKVMLAVLPFANLSGDPEQDYFSDGLTEEVIAQIGRLRPEQLGVIARSSVMQFKNTTAAIHRIGEELHVDYVVEGSVRRSGRRVRITAQLIECRDQTHLWAESYDRDLDDVLVVQSDIARALAGEIHVAITPEASGRLTGDRRVDADVYEACLKGRFHWYKLSREHLDIAFDYFRFALDKDPRCALAHAGQAYVWFSRADCGLLPPGDAIPRARDAALRALTLDESLTEVHELLGNIRRHFDWDWAGAERAFRQAITLNPNYADGHFMYSDFLISMDRSEEAVAEMQRALELDPLNFLFRCFRGWHSIYLRRYDEALAQLREVERSEPHYPAVHLGLWGALHQTRQEAQALSAAGRFFELLGDREVAMRLAGSSNGDYRHAMRAAAEALAARAQQAHVPAVRVARLFAHAGDDGQALAWLERALAERETALVHLLVSWDWDALRATPQFQALLRRMRLTG